MGSRRLRLRLRAGVAIGPLAAALAALALLAPAVQAASPPSLDLGFGDSLFTSSDTAVRDLWLGRAARSGATVVRIAVSWSRVAPAAPPAFNPSDPGSPGYEWGGVDAAVRSAEARHLRVLLTVYSAPAWAEGAGRPATAYPGSWEPQPAAYGAFARALAGRYSGSFPDPLAPGAVLPRVSYFEAWNEPNLDNYLAPQWQGRRLVGPSLYRDLLNSFYAGVKGAQPTATVIGGSLAPFGDPPGGHRTPPVQFLRDLLCLRGAALRPLPCPHPAHLDVLSSHPIAVGPPRASALSPLDASTPDLGRLNRVLRRAERARRVSPAGHRPLWVTEFWYDSDPPDPDGVPLARQARWYAQDLYLFWRQGARVAIALQLRDSPPGRGYPYTSQSGLFFPDGSAKPALTAFRFPLVARRLGRDRALVWGIAPQPGRVQVQARHGGQWRTVAVVAPRGRSRPFAVSLRLRLPALLRARLGEERSLAWRQR